MLTEKDLNIVGSWTSKNSYLKEVDYAAKSDMGKAKLSLVPRRIIWDIATIREYGNNKYPDGGPDNWRSVEPERYRDAAFRHFLRYLDDPKAVDDESGLPHLWHLACNIAFLCELEAEDKESITLYSNGEPYLVINPDNGIGITLDDRVSITKPKTESEEESKEAPSIVPKRAEGEWIVSADGDSLCSECGASEEEFIFGTENWYGIGISNYCPNCGKKMKGAEESSERSCVNCKYEDLGAFWETCRTCEDGFTNWEPKTETRTD